MKVKVSDSSTCASNRGCASIVSVGLKHVLLFEAVLVFEPCASIQGNTVSTFIQQQTKNKSTVYSINKSNNIIYFIFFLTKLGDS